MLIFQPDFFGYFPSSDDSGMRKQPHIIPYFKNIAGITRLTLRISHKNIKKLDSIRKNRYIRTQLFIRLFIAGLYGKARSS